MARAKVGAAEWERRKSLVGRWRRGGHSAAEFAERHGISAWTLYSWAQRFGGVRGRSNGAARPKREVDLVPVRLLGSAEETRRGPWAMGVEIQLRGGDVVRLLGETSAEQLRAVVTALRESC